MWNERTLPILTMHNDEIISFIKKITTSFEDFILANPQDMNLKFHQPIEIPYEEEVCTVSVENEDMNEHKEFVKIYDENFKVNLQRNKRSYMSPSTIERYKKT